MLKRSSAFIMLLAIAASACREAPTATSPHGEPSASFQFSATQTIDSIKPVPALDMHAPDTNRSWEASDEALISEVERQDGHVIVAFKAEDSQSFKAERSTRLVRGRPFTVGVRPRVPVAAIKAGLDLLSTQGARLIKYFDEIGAAYVRIDPELSPMIRDHALVDYLVPRQDSRLGAQSTPWGVDSVEATTAWSDARGDGSKIMIIDTGHEQGHPDLPYVPNANCGGGQGDGCTDQLYWHGTHVLGIIAMRDNTIGYVGGAPEVDGSDTYVWDACGGSCNNADIVNGLNQAITWAVDIVNMSLFTGDFYEPLANATAAVHQAGIVQVGIAGNGDGNTVTYPAGHPNVIGVSGINSDGSFAGEGSLPSFCADSTWSNSGSHVDLSAPHNAWSTHANGSYDQKCGTSMAAPHVSAAAALLRAEYPSLSVDSLTNRLLNTATDHGPVGRDDNYGYGVVNAAAALSPMSAAISGPTYISKSGEYTWEATRSGGYGPFNYTWYYRIDHHEPTCDYVTAWQQVGTNSSYSRQVFSHDYHFQLRVEVESEAQHTSELIKVFPSNPIACPLSTLSDSIDTD